MPSRPAIQREYRVETAEGSGPGSGNHETDLSAPAAPFVLAINAHNILGASVSIFLVVVCHNLLGMAFGYAAGRMWKFDEARCRALCFEVGTQNSGLATALALAHFSPVSAIAGALFSVWQNISGALVSNYFHGAEIRQGKP